MKNFFEKMVLKSTYLCDLERLHLQSIAGRSTKQSKLVSFRFKIGKFQITMKMFTHKKHKTKDQSLPFYKN